MCGNKGNLAAIPVPGGRKVPKKANLDQFIDSIDRDHQRTVRQR